MPDVVEPEHGRPWMRARELAELWVVPIDDKRRPGAECSDGAAPALGDQLELAVAVELVAEEIAEAHDPRADARCDLRQRPLVDLEQPQLRAARRKQRRRDPRDQVGTGPVVREPKSGPQGLGGHRRGRRLAVRRGDESGALRQPGGQAVDRAGVELPEQLAGDGRPAAAARQA